MNLSPRWASALNAGGIQASHWSELGAATASDATIMRFAVAHDWIVMTHDLDFGAIPAATQDQAPSVVQVRADNLDPDVIGERIVRALRQMRAELAQGALLSVDTARDRLRMLPLGRRES